MRASQIFEPATPIKIREPRNLHLGWVLAVAVLALAGFGAYHFYPKHTSADPTASASVTLHSHSTSTAKASTTSKPAAKKPTVPEAVIRLTAAQDCWVGLNSTTGQTLYQGLVLAGSTKVWNEKDQVSLTIGNPPGITLTVNGKTQQLAKGQVARLSINPLSKTPVQVG
jgi:hypothetical protein